jgi:hypothetical protein
MDGSRFDELARTLARRSSRRGAIRVLTGSLGGVLALAGLGRGDDAAAQCRAAGTT